MSNGGAIWFHASFDGRGREWVTTIEGVTEPQRITYEHRTGGQVNNWHTIVLLWLDCVLESKVFALSIVDGLPLTWETEWVEGGEGE